MEDDENAKLPSIKDDAARLFGDSRVLAGKTDAELMRIAVEDVLLERERSDAFVAGAFRELARGDARVPLARRDMFRAAHRHAAHRSVQ
jgi:hypothetical protein